MEGQSSPSEIVKIIVTLERPEPSELKALNRFQKYKELRANSIQRRKDLLIWMEKEGLSDQVEKVEAATAFNLLFVRSTREIAERIKRAPGVMKVSVAARGPNL